MTSSDRDRGGTVASNIPNVKMATGHGVTPNMGIAG
jgi:hypothetical protein